MTFQILRSTDPQILRSSDPQILRSPRFWWLWWLGDLHDFDDLVTYMTLMTMMTLMTLMTPPRDRFELSKNECKNESNELDDFLDLFFVTKSVLLFCPNCYFYFTMIKFANIIFLVTSTYLFWFFFHFLNLLFSK